MVLPWREPHYGTVVENRKKRALCTCISSVLNNSTLSGLDKATFGVANKRYPTAETR